MTTDMSQDLNPPRDPYGLAALPQLKPAGDAWPQIEAALRRHQAIKRTAKWLAAAATVTLVVGIYLQLPPTPAAAGLQRTASVASQSAGAPSVKNSNSLAALIRLSQTLERNLNQIRAETGVMPAQSVVYQVELEDMVAQVDEAINLQPDSRELWSQRVNLLLDLNQLYGQQLRREYHRLASL